jgi:hypothetical protein
MLKFNLYATYLVMEILHSWKSTLPMIKKGV